MLGGSGALTAQLKLAGRLVTATAGRGPQPLEIADFIDASVLLAVADLGGQR